MKIGESLKELIQENNLSADALSKRLGVSGSIVARWIRENKPIKLFNLLKLAEYFDCSVDFICGRTSDRGKFIPAQMTFHDKVLSLLESSEKAKDKIFTEIGLNRHVIYDWLKGSVPLSSNLIALADYFGCTIDFLLGFEK